MRLPAFFSMTMLAATTMASAQGNLFYAERGHWTVMNSSTRCYAWNRPAADFNAFPYNALQITAGPKSTISVDVFFWPGAVMMDREYKLQLYFSAGDVTLPAKPTFGDFVLATVPDMGLWRKAGGFEIAGGGRGRRAVAQDELHARRHRLGDRHADDVFDVPAEGVGHHLRLFGLMLLRRFPVRLRGGTRKI